MARTSCMASLCALAACGYLAVQAGRAFVPAPAAGTPSLRGEAGATAAAVALGLSAPAGAFVYEGKEYYDTTLGYGPLPWAVAAITLISFGAQLLKTVKKYQPPPPITPVLKVNVDSYLNTSERNMNIEFPWDRKRQNAIKAAAAKNGTGSQR